MYNNCIFLIKKVFAMRTKHVLMAMALPALFAACTADEFVEQANQGNLAGRALLGNLNVNVANNDATTRFAWDNYAWSFEDGDQFGAAVVDPTQIDAISDSEMLGNYIFTKGSEGYTTTSQMVEGTYMFYSYDGFVKKNNRNLIEFDLSTQYADLNDPKKVISDNYLFFSPLYKIEAENTTDENNIELPLRFTPYWATAAFRIKNSTGADFSISQIVLNGSFIAKGEINPQAINGEKMFYSVPEGGDAYELTKLNPKGELTDEKVEEAYKAAYKDKNFSINGETSGTIALDCDDYVLANGEEVTAYMQVPVSKQTSLTASIIVKVNGVSKEIKVTNTKANGTSTGTYSIASAGINKLSFDRSKTTAVFGLESNGDAKVLDVKANNLQDAGGFYVDNNEELLEVLDNERGDISFYNASGVTLNDDVISVLNSYNAGAITFSNPISIEVEDEDGLTLSSNVDAGITFKGDVTVESGIVTLGENVTLEKDLTVKAGTVTLNGVALGASYASNITVEAGELKIASEITANKIDMKAGVLTVAKSLVYRNSGNIKELAFADDKNITFNVAGAQNNAVELTLYNGLVIPAKTTLNINGFATVQTAGTATVTINGTVENYGTIVGTAGVLTLAGSTNNYATITDVTNNGFITMKDFWESSLTLDGTTPGTGYIDNTVGVDLGTITGNTAYSYSTGNISNIPSSNVSVVILNNATVADGTEVSTPTAAQTILLLGNNTFGTMGGEGITINDPTNTTLQIGLVTSADPLETLARKVAGIAATTTIAKYDAAMTTTVNAGTITVNTLKCYGGTNRNAGTITYSSGTPGTWQGTAPSSL